MKFNNILSYFKILYLEDDESIRANIQDMLSLLCKEVIAVSTIEEAQYQLENYTDINIFLSDINIHDKNSLDFIEKFRIKNKSIPIIILSAYTDKEYLLQATKLKLTDYLVKPVKFEDVLSALNKAASEIIENSTYEITFSNNSKYNLFSKTLFCNDTKKEIHLTKMELDLLELLLKNQQKAVSTDEIKNTLWDYPEDATDSALKNLINKTRKKIGKESIINISKVGYKLQTN